MTTQSMAAAVFLTVGVGLAACSSSTSSGGNAHTATLESDRTSAQVGDSIEFNLQGTGQLLAGIAINYGDGAADTVAAEGAVSAGMRRKHAYAEPGTYVAVGSVVDAGTLGLVVMRDSVTVQISGGQFE